MRWCDRALLFAPYHFGLCLSESQYHRELRRMKLPRDQWPSFLLNEHSNATTHFFVKGSTRAAIVCLGSTKNVTREQVYSLLVHEAVHIWQECRASIGEKFPSPEFEAYSIQSISQGLMLAYAKAKP